MNFLLVLWLACRWNSFVLASPSRRYVILERSLAMVRSKEASLRHLHFSSFLNWCSSLES